MQYFVAKTRKYACFANEKAIGIIPAYASVVVVGSRQKYEEKQTKASKRVRTEAPLHLGSPNIRGLKSSNPATPYYEGDFKKNSDSYS